MADELNDALKSMEERIRKVKQYVSTLEQENRELKEQIDTLQDNISKTGKGDGNVLAKKNIELTDIIRRFKREREFIGEKIKSIMDEVEELKRNIE